MATEVLNRDEVEAAFNFFETQKTLLTKCTEQWKKLSTHFTSQEESLAKKSADLDSKLESLDSETKKTLESLEQRENSISERESSLIARVEEQKQSALSEFEKPLVSDKVELGETLKSLCRKMDSLGLLRFMTAKRKEASTLRTQIALAIQEAVDSPRLVLDVVDDFIEKKEVKGGVSDRRWACGTLISTLFPAEVKTLAVAGSIAERATRVVETWKGKMESEEGSGGGVGHVEATMFLQLVVGFGIISKFEEEFLKKLILENPSRRDMPKLAASLGLGEKMGDIIDELVKSGKEIDAVYFACECGLTERFPPVDLLKNYLKKSRTEATTILKNNRYSAAATESSGNVELNSVKAIIKCVEDHNLESKFTLQSLRKRASQLEKIKADKRKNASSNNKRARGSGGGGGGGGFRPAKYGRGSDSYSSYGHRNPGPAHQNPVAAYSGSYNYPNQGAGYKGPASSSYASHYGAHSRSPAALPPHYSLPPENVGAAASQVTGSYGGAQTTYGGYDYSAVAPSSYQPPFPQ